MSVHESNARRRLSLSASPKSARRGLACAVLTGVLGLSALWSCGNSSNPDNGDGGQGASTTGSATTGTTVGVTTAGGIDGAVGTTGTLTGTTTGTTTSGATTSGATTSGTGTGTTGTTTSGTTTNGATTNGTTGTTTGTTTSGISDAGPDSTLGDGAVACTNTNTSVINIDSSGWACNNQWGIQGAWYCYQDPSIPVITGGCAGTGVIPYNATSGAMCISGVTSNAAASATVYGAGIGLVLNQPAHGADAGKNALSDKNIVGFAITISGDTGGSVLNINLPPALTASGESAAVTVPGVSSGSSPVTYTIMNADAIVSDNASAPIPKINPANLTDVQVAIPSGDKISHTYDFCVTKIVPITAAPTAPASLANYGPTFNEGKQIVLEGMGPYGLQNDPFNVGGDQMTMQAQYGGGKAGFTVTPLGGFTSSNTSPGAFPSIVSGWITGGNIVSPAEGGYAGTSTIGGAKPLTTATSSWTYTAGGGSWDAAYDCWLSSPGFNDPVTAGFELMVWLGHNTANPIGFPGTAVTINGSGWTVSRGTNTTGQPVVSYLINSNVASVTDFNLLPFFNDGVMNRGIPAGAVLLSVQAGFELYNTGTWTTNSYNITLQ